MPPHLPNRSSSLGPNNLHSRSAEHLPTERNVPQRSQLAREINLSTTSLPYLNLEAQTSVASSIQQVRQGPPNPTVGDLDELDDTDEDVPEIIVFDNVPLSPVAPYSVGEKTSPPRLERLQTIPDLATLAQRDNSGEHLHESNTRPLSYHESLLSEMDADTRQLTAQLNDHHTQKLHAQAIGSNMNSTNPHSPARTRSDRKASARRIVENLRPVIDQRLESVPISKEKEAILACTRPTHLPPKSRKEEKKHLKEYEKLMFGSLEATKKSQKRQSKEVTQKAKHLTDSADTWTNQILPHFATAVKDPRTRTLWWSGLPNRVRGRIWSICIGNTLSVNEDTFNMALSKSLDTEQFLRERDDHENDDDNHELLTLESYTLLEQSVARTFVDLNIFQKGGPLHESLVQVLKAYLYYRQDVMVSYIEGVNYIAGLLLLYLPPLQTFVTMVNVLNRALPLALYTRDEPVLNRFAAIFMTRLSQSLPRLHKHLHDELQIPPLTYLEPMLVSLLAKQSPVDISSRIFDIYAFEGDAFLMRAVIGVFISLEHALYGTAEEVLVVLSGTDKEHTWEKNLREDDFIKRCRSAF